MSGHAARPARGTGPRSGRRWILAAGIISAFVILTGGAAALLTFSSAPATRPLAAGCGLVTCGAHLPPAVTGLAAHGTARHPAHLPAPPKTPAHALPHRGTGTAPLPGSPVPTPSLTPGSGGQSHHDGWHHDGSWHHGQGQQGDQ
jgi:hypothetical protein